MAIIAVLCFKMYSDRLIYSDYSKLVERNDSLRHELLRVKSKRDTIYRLIDSSKVKVEVIERWYEKKAIDIANQSTTDDMLFFTDYISNHEK